MNTKHDLGLPSGIKDATQQQDRENEELKLELSKARSQLKELQEKIRELKKGLK